MLFHWDTDHYNVSKESVTLGLYDATTFYIINIWLSTVFTITDTVYKRNLRGIGINS